MKEKFYNKRHIIAVLAIIGILLIAVMVLIDSNSNEIVPVDTGKTPVQPTVISTAVQEPVIEIMGPMNINVAPYLTVTVENNLLSSVKATNNGKLVLNRYATDGKTSFALPLETGLNDVVITCYSKSGQVIGRQATVVSVK